MSAEVPPWTIQDDVWLTHDGTGGGRTPADERSLLTAPTYQYVFGSWNDALREIGREPNRVYSNDDTGN